MSIDFKPVERKSKKSGNAAVVTDRGEGCEGECEEGSMGVSGEVGYTYVALPLHIQKSILIQSLMRLTGIEEI